VNKPAGYSSIVSGHNPGVFFFSLVEGVDSVDCLIQGFLKFDADLVKGVTDLFFTYLEPFNGEIRGVEFIRVLDKSLIAVCFNLANNILNGFPALGSCNLKSIGESLNCFFAVFCLAPFVADDTGYKQRIYP